MIIVLIILFVIFIVRIPSAFFQVFLHMSINDYEIRNETKRFAFDTTTSTRFVRILLTPHFI